MIKKEINAIGIFVNKDKVNTSKAILHRAKIIIFTLKEKFYLKMEKQQVKVTHLTMSILQRESGKH